MKISKDEYQNVLIHLTLKQYGFICVIASLAAFISGFLANYLYDKEFLLDFIISLIISIVFYFVMRKALVKTAKKVIINNDIKYVEQEIDQESIIQKIVRNDNSELNNKFLLSNLVKVKEDKNNFYLYVNKNEVIPVIKEKIENMDVFRKNINEKCSDCLKGEKM